MSLLYLLLALLVAIVLGLAVLAHRLRRALGGLRDRFAPVVAADEEAGRIRRTAQLEVASLHQGAERLVTEARTSASAFA
jgi:hypothetical protein